MFKLKKRRNLDAKGRIKRAHEKLGLLTYKVVRPATRLYLRQKHVRTRVLITNEGKEVLLVRSWFSHQKWSLPGGGIRHDEKPAEAAAREMFEETGIRAAVDDLEELGTFRNPDPQRPFTIACFGLSVPKRPPQLAKRHRFEILEVEWFSIDSLPPNRSATVDIALSLTGGM